MTATEAASTCFEVGCDADVYIAALGHLRWITAVLAVALLGCIVAAARDIAYTDTEEND